MKRERITPEVAAKFLTVLGEIGIVTEAARAAGVSRQAFYARRGRNADFARAWDEAEEVVTHALEDEALRRALHGTERPVYYGGKEVGTVRDYSDALLIMLLKARRPELYRERRELSGVVRLSHEEALAQLE